ncbi:MAG: putative amino-acid ABC transporter-binding protein [Chlamydiales bacterium]|nr:putative amino-acid ABC transporter-binding protein [Chlamydiales bacterium]
MVAFMQVFRRLCFFLSLIVLMGCVHSDLEYGEYTIGRDPSWFPLQMGQRSPKLVAFTNALVQEIAQSEKEPFNVVDITWIQLFQKLEQKKVAAIFTSVSPNIITKSKYTFSEPFLKLGPVLVVRADSHVSSLEQMKGQIIAVNQFDESVLIAQKYPVIITQYQGLAAVLDLLATGKVDGVLMPNLDALSLVPHLYPHSLKIVTEPLNNKALRVITLKGEREYIIKKFNKGLESLKKNSNYSSARKEFNLD